VKTISIYIIGILLFVSFVYPFYIGYLIKKFQTNEQIQQMKNLSYYSSIKYLNKMQKKQSNNQTLMDNINNILWHYRISNYVTYITIILGFVWYWKWGNGGL